jgi:hypothetical protein
MGKIVEALLEAHLPVQQATDEKSYLTKCVISLRY